MAGVGGGIRLWTLAQNPPRRKASAICRTGTPAAGAAPAAIAAVVLSSRLGDRFSVLHVPAQLSDQGWSLPIGSHAVGRLRVLVQDAQGGRPWGARAGGTHALPGP